MNSNIIHLRKHLLVIIYIKKKKIDDLMLIFEFMNKIS